MTSFAFATLLPSFAIADNCIEPRTASEPLLTLRNDVRTRYAGPEGERPPEQQPGTFTTLGSPNRMWELRSDTGFGEPRVLTQRFEVAHIMPFSRYCLDRADDGVRFGLVVRATFGLSGDLTTGFATPQGIQPALGIRMRRQSDTEWVEAGFRGLFGYPGPQTADPRMQRLAYASTITSGVADDATWLPINAFGLQFYLTTQVRTPEIKDNLFGLHIHWAFGFTGGVAGSITPISIDTPLGTQKGFVGNAYLENFFTLISTSTKQGKWTNTHALNFQIGGHVEASLTSFWDAANALPIAANVFVGWSPVPAFAMRIFYGTGGTLGGFDFSAVYGLRLQFFLPSTSSENPSVPE